MTEIRSISCDFAARISFLRASDLAYALVIPLIALSPRASAEADIICFGCCASPCCDVCGPPGGGSFVRLAGRYGHQAAIRSDGTVACWGANHRGQCNVPAGLGFARDIAVGEDFTVAVLADGTIRCWGFYVGWIGLPLGIQDAVEAAAGLGHSAIRDAAGVVHATGHTAPAGLVASRIASGDEHLLAIRQDGTLVAWGVNSSGQCSVPLGLGACIAAAGGGSHSIAITREGAVRCFGANNYGQCSVPAGLGPALGAAAGREHTVVLLADGSLRGWGRNFWGESTPPPVSSARRIACGWSSSYAILGPACPSDLNRDGAVDGEDLSLLLYAWGSTDLAAGPADIDSDWMVGHSDLAILLADWGSCQ
jgi:Regulator of chromosome condensation (RCC1) repeat